MAISAAEYQRRLQKVTKISVLRELVYDILIKRENELRQLKEEDFEIGDIYGTGTRIPYKSKAYESFKASLNPKAGGAVDLLLSRDFVDDMFLVRGTPSKYRFGNSNYKASPLTKNYGKGIFGLNDKRFFDYQIKILPIFQKSIKQYANID